MDRERSETKSSEILPGEGSGRRVGTVQKISTRVHSLIVGALSQDTSTARATRARLRAAVGMDVGSMPEIWALTLDPFCDDISNDSLDPSPRERALHAALTLWAIHQGAHSALMHIKGEKYSFGRAVGVLAHRGNADAPEETSVYKRLCAMASAQTYSALVTRARGLIELLKAEAIPLDYGQFAVELFRWQDPRARASVIRQWGRGFVGAAPNTEQEQ